MLSEDTLITNFKSKVVKTILIPCMEKDMASLILRRKCWDYTCSIFGFLEVILLCSLPIFNHLGMTTTGSIVVALILGAKYSISLSASESSKTTDTLNSHFKNIGIKHKIEDMQDEDNDININNSDSDDDNDNDKEIISMHVKIPDIEMGKTTIN